MDYLDSLNSSNSSNSPPLNFTSDDFDSPFQYLYIQLLFGILYVAVFLGCICGNALVMFVIIRHKRMRNITNFFLANLAASDFCVGIFCVIPNLLTYFSPFWVAGQAMCKLYFFIQSVSYTASILILTVISMERYFAIIHPMLSRRLCRMTLMRVIIIVVWIAALAYGTPSLFAYGIIVPNENKTSEAFCFLLHDWLKVHVMVLINFFLFYCVPLILMSIMYIKISIVLWHSSFMTANAKSETTRPKAHQRQESETTLMAKDKSASFCNPNKVPSEESKTTNKSTSISRKQSSSTKTVLASRRKVIRLLIAIVVSFAVCMLPHHARLLYEMWTPLSFPISFAQSLVPPSTFFMFYLNSALNPILYAFLSDNFRKSLMEVCGCGKNDAWRNGGSMIMTKMSNTPQNSVCDSK